VGELKLFTVRCESKMLLEGFPPRVKVMHETEPPVAMLQFTVPLTIVIPEQSFPPILWSHLIPPVSV
jgi:hypothetical protein